MEKIDVVFLEDDNECLYLYQAICKFWGITFRMFDTVHEAYHSTISENLQFKVLILDKHLNGFKNIQKGFALRQNLYDNYEYNSYETILVSADIQPEDELTISQLGRTHVIHKPFSMIDDLFPLIQSILKRRSE